MSDELKPCPWCGGGATEIVPNGRVWAGTKWGEPSSVSVRHWCKPVDGQPSRMIERVGRDEASAIEAWNRRTPSPAVGAGMPELPEPYATLHHDDGYFTMKREHKSRIRPFRTDAFNADQMHAYARDYAASLASRPVGDGGAPGWVCAKCDTDRTKAPCPRGHSAALTGECPMVGAARTAGTTGGEG